MSGVVDDIVESRSNMRSRLERYMGTIQMRVFMMTFLIVAGVCHTNSTTTTGAGSASRNGSIGFVVNIPGR